MWNHYTHIRQRKRAVEDLEQIGREAVSSGVRRQRQFAKIVYFHFHNISHIEYSNCTKGDGEISI